MGLPNGYGALHKRLTTTARHQYPSSALLWCFFFCAEVPGGLEAEST